jgi:acetate---CoA ligase (ADP-forming) subunit beta
VLNETERTILERSASQGWVLEPDSKRLLASAGFTIPRGIMTSDPEEAVAFFADNDGPVVMKVVSPNVLHKSEFRGVVTGITDEETLRKEFTRLHAIEGAAGVLIEETARGIELILGAVNDYQFGPVILLGFGGTGVEIYRDSTMRMAPVGKETAGSMLLELKARPLLEGFRGGPAVDIEALIRTVTRFSEFATGLEDIFDSIDINPLICGTRECTAADARILLTPGENSENRERRDA